MHQRIESRTWHEFEKIKPQFQLLLEILRDRPSSFSYKIVQKLVEAYPSAVPQAVLAEALQTETEQRPTKRIKSFVPSVHVIISRLRDILTDEEIPLEIVTYKEYGYQLVTHSDSDQKSINWGFKFSTTERHILLDLFKGAQSRESLAKIIATVQNKSAEQISPNAVEQAISRIRATLSELRIGKLSYDRSTRRYSLKLNDYLDEPSLKSSLEETILDHSSFSEIDEPASAD